MHGYVKAYQYSSPIIYQKPNQENTDSVQH